MSKLPSGLPEAPTQKPAVTYHPGLSPELVNGHHGFRNLCLSQNCAHAQLWAHTHTFMRMCVNMNTSENVHTCTHAYTRRLSLAPGSPQRDVQDEDSAVHYVLLSAPWAVLCYYAEDLRLKLPLQVRGVGAQGGPGPRPGLLITAPHVLGWSFQC